MEQDTAVESIIQIRGGLKMSPIDYILVFGLFAIFVGIMGAVLVKLDEIVQVLKRK